MSSQVSLIDIKSEPVLATELRNQLDKLSRESLVIDTSCEHRTDTDLLGSEDIIIDRIVDDFVSDDDANHGVSIQFLVDFATACNCWDITTRDVCSRFVMPLTRSTRCSFVELPEMKKCVGRATTFVTHTWESKFGDLVAALCDGDADRSRIVWVDIFAVRQWSNHKIDLDFSAVVRQCESVIVVCSSLPKESYVCLSLVRKDYRRQVPFMLVRCLVEICTAIQCHAVIICKGGHFDVIHEGIIRFVRDVYMLECLSLIVDIEFAEAKNSFDKEKLLGMIRATDGGLDAVNQVVRGALTGGSMTHPWVQNAACGDGEALQKLLYAPSKYMVDAASSGSVKLLQTLIVNGGDINMESEGFYTPLEVAVMCGHLESVSLLLNNNKCTIRDRTCLLYFAAEGGHSSVVQLLLDFGCDVNALYLSYTPLMRAALREHSECVKLLIDKGADVNLVTDKKNTAVMCAALGKRPKSLQILVDRGANVHAKENRTAIVHAAYWGSAECVEILAKSGCDMEVTDNGDTALIAAVKKQHLSCVQALLNAGCQVDHADDWYKMTALEWAEGYNLRDFIKILRRV